MSSIKELKKPIRAFMQAHYTDERLSQLLAHAQEGKLNFFSCCCFIGVATADHALQMNLSSGGDNGEHYWRAKRLPGAREAEGGFRQFARADGLRRRILIPMIRTEMKRRAAKPIAESVEVVCGR